MATIQIDPYIFFKGECREAMEFYKGIFGGELTIQKYSESGDQPELKEHPDWVMHGLLDGDVRIMASDTEKASDKAAKIDLSLSGDDADKLHKYFDGLAEGGKVQFPLEKQFWGDIFGMLTDKYGIEWMVNITEKS
ncbi:MAG TPA: VOC family protein [Candidatus Babeliales bacterium]|nr:VOC family protein [Candidatus Babeliales bacterium]